MSNKCLNAVFDRSKSRGVARLVMLAVADRANDQGRAYFGMSDLRARTNASESHLHLAIRGLKKQGELQVDSRKGPMNCNIYRLADVLLSSSPEDGGQLRASRATTSSENKSGGSYFKSGDSYNKSPDSYLDAADSYHKTQTLRPPDPNQREPLITPIEPRGIALPDSLKGQEGFEKLWAEFEAMRVEKGRPLTTRGRVILLDVLAERPSDAKDALRLALTREWQEIRWEWYDRARSQEAVPRPSSAPYAPAVPHASSPIAPLLPKPHQRVDRTLLDPAAVTAYLDKNYPFLGRSHPPQNLLAHAPEDLLRDYIKEQSK